MKYKHLLPLFHSFQQSLPMLHIFSYLQLKVKNSQNNHCIQCPSWNKITIVNALKVWALNNKYLTQYFINYSFFVHFVTSCFSNRQSKKDKNNIFNFFFNEFFFALIHERRESGHTRSNPFFLIGFAFVVQNIRTVRWDFNPHDEVRRVTRRR